MDTILLYSLKSALVLALLYIPYMLILRKESFFRLNRLVLLSIMLLSAILPLMDVHMLSIEHQPVVQVAKMQMIEVGIPLPYADADMSSVLTTQANINQINLSWFSIVSAVFSIVALGLFLYRTMSMLRMWYSIGKGALWHQAEEGTNIYCYAHNVSPYSWMNNIVISQADYQESGREILLHEKAHVHNHHSWDILLLSLVQICQWWNPLVYILSQSLRDVHEFEADDSVLSNGVSARQYQLLLIKKVVGSSSYTFANNFNHSLTLKRITMMQKSKSSWWMSAKALYILPMSAIALSAFATSKTMPSAEGEYSTSGNKVKDLYANVQALSPESAPSSLYLAPQKEAVTTPLVKVPAHIPEYPGGQAELMKFIGQNIKYPAVAHTYGVQGRVLIQFTVGKDGNLYDFNVLRFGGHDAKSSPNDLPEIAVTAYAKEQKANGRDITAEERAKYKEGVQAIIDEALRVAKSMPKWTPGYKDKDKKEVCATQFVLPVMFKLK